MKDIKRYTRIMVMSAVALGMTAALNVENAMAYFTTYVSSAGGGTVSIGSSTLIHEDPVVDMTKKIRVENTSENECFVRVKVFSGDLVDFHQTFSQEEGQSNWTEGEEGYWYYSEILPGKSPDAETGPMTEVLNVKIDVPEGYERDDFNVVVIQECVPVLYDEEGRPYADWKVGKGAAD